MHLSSANTRRPARLFIGVGLIAWLWLLAAIIAFGPFDRETEASVVVAVTLAAFMLSVGLLARRRWIDWETGLYALLTVVMLIGLYNVPLRDDLPADALALVESYSAQQPDRHAFARDLFWDVSRRFTAPAREYLLQPQRIFLLKSSAYYWETRGYVPSHLLTQLYRHMLIASGRFQPEEVKFRTGRCFNSPHGFLEIAHPDRKLHADLWAARHFEEYEFGQVVDMPSCEGIAETTEPQGEGL